MEGGWRLVASYELRVARRILRDALRILATHYLLYHALLRKTMHYCEKFFVFLQKD